MDCVSEDFMALSANDKTWIQGEIRAATEARGWARFARWLRDWGLLATAFTATLSIVAIAVTAIIFAVSEVRANSEFRGQTKTRLDRIEEDVRVMRLKQAALSPTDPKSLEQAQKILADSKSGKAPALSASTVSEAGRSFVQAAQYEPNIWETALSFVAYRSQLTVRPAKDAIKSVPPSGSPPAGTQYSLNAVPGKPAPIMGYLAKIVPQDQAARAERLSSPILQNQSAMGLAMFGITGGALDLDDMYLRHVILVDVEVHYGGGAAHLQDVTFINCSFVMNNDANARQLADNILDTDHVNLSLD